MNTLNTYLPNIIMPVGAIEAPTADYAGYDEPGYEKGVFLTLKDM